MGDLISDLEQIRREYERQVAQVTTSDTETTGQRERPDSVSRLAADSRRASCAAGRVVFSDKPQPGAKSANPRHDLLRGKVNVSSENPDNNEAAIKLLSRRSLWTQTSPPPMPSCPRLQHQGALFRAAQKEKLNEDAEVDVEKRSRWIPIWRRSFCPWSDLVDALQALPSRTGDSVVQTRDRIES